MHRISTRYQCLRLSWTDPATGAPVRAQRRHVVRYERATPGELVHVDIKKLGRIPDGGGHRVHGRQVGGVNSSAHRDPSRPRKVHGRPNLGYAHLHHAVADHSRYAYSEILGDETKETSTAPVGCPSDASDQTLSKSNPPAHKDTRASRPATHCYRSVPSGLRLTGWSSGAAD